MNFTPDERSTYALVNGDVLLAEASGSEGQIGRPAIWGGELPLCCFQNTVIRFRPHVVLPAYALLVFRQYLTSGVFAETARGIGIQHLGASRFAQLPFPLPPFAEQERIVEEAGRRIAELHSAAAALETAFARTHEQDLEVLATAVGGHLDGAGLGEQSDSGPAGVGSVPPGWNLRRVDEAGEVRLGRQRSPANHSGPDMRPYLRVANVFEDRIDVDDVKEMNFTPEEFETFRLEQGDVLLNEGQSPELVGRPAIYRGNPPGACFQNTLLRFRAGSDVEPEFALLVFRHYLHGGEFRSRSRGSTNIAHLSRTRFAEMPFPLPPMEEQRTLVERATRLLSESQERREMITGSIQRIAAVEAEILDAAVGGGLVPQEEGDEPADRLLARSGAPPEDRIDIDTEAMGEREMAEKQTPVKRDQGGPLLASTLKASGPLTIPELYRAAEFDPNEIGDVERFYLALRDEIGTSVETTGDAPENQTLRAVADAS